MRRNVRGGRKEYRALVAKTIVPTELSLAGALQIARLDRQIGVRSPLTRTWLVTSRAAAQLSEALWLEREQGRWGIETRNHHTLDVTQREDESRVRQPNAATVLGIFRRLSNALKQVWAEDRPKRAATGRDWAEENQFNRWLGIELFTRPARRANLTANTGSHLWPDG